MSKKYVDHGPVAHSVPFDPDNDPNCDLTSETTQEAIEELCNSARLSASPGFAFGREGNISANTYLFHNDVPSQRTGIPFGLVNGAITNIWVGNQDINTFDITIYEHDGDKINLTSLVTVSVVASRSQEFDVGDFGAVNPTAGKQLAARVTSGSCKRPAVFLTIKGDIA